MTKKTQTEAPAVTTNVTTVTLLGKEVKLKYSFNAEVCFYKITGKSIEKMDAESPSDLVALVIACEMAALGCNNEGEDIPVDSAALLDDASSAELVNVIQTCILLRAAWYKQPDDTPAPKKTEGKN
jgi:hypothetical protein